MNRVFTGEAAKDSCREIREPRENSPGRIYRMNGMAGGPVEAMKAESHLISFRTFQLRTPGKDCIVLHRYKHENHTQ
jgi:hypothetical protein